ncbi:MAG: hypothetical protein CVV64_10795 [Candidatus Wallbacteria bacterium HGW-Wallbacteria-1]|jgi:HEAT repeat protein|uniref:HEAT repeat domain-containing protein n=1 Tax=Candidatus Wallbacteria bacterium HGW-Wallbacteria-1 TaxID=2013854 RepID=A0A2N1PPE3_9BACT|nr:MAG: hypothetical protein CVV64_10795 [Candidatus Wallbacteria bacterium HGW-Wallbacteria-1]
MAVKLIPEEIEKMVESDSPDQRRKACILLFNRGNDEWCLDTAAKLTSSDDPQVRYYANKALTAICRRIGKSEAEYRSTLRGTPVRSESSPGDAVSVTPADDVNTRKDLLDAFQSGDTLTASIAMKRAGQGDAKQKAEHASALTEMLKNNPTAPLFGLALKGIATLDANSIIKWGNELLADQNPRIRADAAEALAMCGNSDAKAMILPLLEDIDPRTRANAAVALAGQYHEQVMSCLENMLSSSSDADRESGLWALGRIDPPDLSKRLKIFFVKEKITHIRKRALKYLLRGSKPDPIEVLRKLSETQIDSEGMILVQSALHALNSAGDPAGQTESASQTESADHAGEKSDLTAFRLMNDSPPEAASRLDAIFLLDHELSANKGEDYFDNLISDLTSAMKSPDPRIRSDAAEGFRRISSENAVTALSRALKDPDNIVRSHARRALEQIKKTDSGNENGSISTLTSRLGNLDPGKVILVIIFVAISAAIGWLLNPAPTTSSTSDSKQVDPHFTRPILRAGSSFSADARVISVNPSTGAATLSIYGRLCNAADKKELLLSLVRGETIRVSGRVNEVRPSGSSVVTIEKVDIRKQSNPSPSAAPAIHRP